MNYYKGHVTIETEETSNVDTILSIDKSIKSNDLVIRAEIQESWNVTFFQRYLKKYSLKAEKVQIGDRFKYCIDLWFIQESDSDKYEKIIMLSVGNFGEYVDLSLKITPPVEANYIFTSKKAEMKKWMAEGFEINETDDNNAVSKISDPQSIKSKKVTTKSFSLKKILQKIVNSEALKLNELLWLVTQHDLIKYSEILGELGEEVDYACESLLEQIEGHIAEFTDADRDTIIDNIHRFWLKLDEVPGGTSSEINVRSAEVIAAYNKGKGITLDELAALVGSEVWQDRLVAGWTIRKMGDAVPEGSQGLRDKLVQDEYCDDNDIFLVRESVGVTDCDE